MLVLGLALSATLCGAAADDENWPQWRGPALDGTSSSTDLPLKWSGTENVKWKAKLPSFSGSTPAIWGDRIFVPSASAPGPDAEARLVKKMGNFVPPSAGLDLILLCLSKKDGSELWRSTIPGENYRIGKHNMTSPSPITDGRRVWWLTGIGVLTAFDMGGKALWKIDLQEKYGKFGINWGYGASPLLHDGRLIVPVMHGFLTDDPSYLVAFEPETGKVLWKVERPTDSPNEGPDAYTTPLPMKVGDRVQIIVAGGDYVTAHEPETGKEIWRCGGFNPRNDKFYRQVCSPGIAGEVVVSCIKQGPTVALRAGGQGLVTETHTLWKSAEILFDVPTPVSDGKHFYILDEKGFVSCVDPKTGTPLYKKERLPKGLYYPSPLLADGKLYLTNDQARTTVIAAGPEFKILAENPLDDVYTVSSIAVSGKNLFIRTSSHLYCIGK
jgi:outer membrane protein assembly factor BamB